MILIRHMQTKGEIHRGSHNGIDWYVTRSAVFDALLGYIDVSGINQLHFLDTEEADRYGLGFHGGCTFCRQTTCIGNLEFSETRFILGCDWAHGIGMFAAENATVDDVVRNLKDVIDGLPAVILRRDIEGKCLSSKV